MPSVGTISQNLFELFEKKFSTSDLSLSGNIFEGYTEIVKMCAPKSLNFEKDYWIHCIIRELDEMFKHLHISHWKQDYDLEIPREAIFEVVDVVLFIMMYYNIVDRKPGFSESLMHTRLKSKKKISVDAKALLCNDMIQSVLRFRDIYTTEKTEILDTRAWSIISTCMQLLDVDYDTLCQACSIKLATIAIRLRDDAYIKGWHKIDRNGFSIDEVCCQYLNDMKKDDEVSPLEVYSSMTMRLQDFVY
jgi:hypothetical protein